MTISNEERLMDRAVLGKRVNAQARKAAHQDEGSICFTDGWEAAHADARAGIEPPAEGVDSDRAQATKHPIAWWHGYRVGQDAVHMKRHFGRPV